MRFAFIAKNADMLPVERLCQIMDVSPRGYRAFRNRPLSQSQRTDMVVLAHIREQFALSLGSYGRPRMTEELKELGFDVGHRRIGRLMRQNSITVKRNKKFKATTDSNHSFNIAPNLLNRNFHADAPNQKWAGDISHVWTQDLEAVLAQDFLVVVGTILAAAIGVVDAALGRPALCDGHLQCTDRQIPFHPVADGPANDTP